MLRAVAPELWVHEEPLRFRGFEIGRRMVVIRLQDGRLWVTSPARLTAELRDALDALGPVAFVVPASKLHGHLFMEDYRAAYPDALLFAAPGLPGRRRDLAFDGLLGGSADPRWAQDIDQAAFLGNVFGEELAFLHRATRTLVLADLCFNIGRDAPAVVRLMAWGSLRPRLGPTPAFRAAIRNRAAAQASLRAILAWDFERVIPGHGEIVEHGGRDQIARAYAWLLNRPAGGG